jgi:hypothetical protein
MATPSIQTLITQAQQVLNLQSSNEIRATLAAVLANANVGTPLNPNLTTQQLWNEFGEIVRQSTDDIMSIVVDQMMRMVFSPPAPGGAGADKQVIFNDGGVLAGDAGLTYNKATDALTITGALTVDSPTLVANAAGYADRVGIGTATPGYLLDITDASVATRFAATNTNNSAYGAGIYLKTMNGASMVSNATLATSNDGTFNLFTGTSADSTKLSINTSGDVNIALGNVVMATSGKGIDFSANNPDPAGKTSELLNDYEEGTWVGTLTGSTTNPTTAVTATGRYTKVGRVVTVSIHYESVSTVGASGNIGISGLPFANNASVPSIGPVSIYQAGTFTGSPFIRVDTSASVIEFFASVSNAVSSNVTHNAGTGRYISTSVSYTVA